MKFKHANYVKFTIIGLFLINISSTVSAYRPLGESCWIYPAHEGDPVQGHLVYSDIINWSTANLYYNSSSASPAVYQITDAIAHHCSSINYYWGSRIIAPQSLLLLDQNYSANQGATFQCKKCVGSPIPFPQILEK